MSNPLVSIVVPSFNQAAFLRETLVSCLEQDYRPIEVIVQDGGSSDESVDVLRSIQSSELSWVSERDDGVVDGVNRALARARGSLLSIQSSDDLFMPGAIAASVDAFHSEPGLGLVFGDVELIDAQSRTIGVDRNPAFDLAEYLGRLSYIPQPGTVFSRAAFESVGGWRPAISYVADADFWIRIALKWPVRKLDRLVGRYRYHELQRDKQRQAIAHDWRVMASELLSSDLGSSRLRRYTRMGRHLATYRYAPDLDWRTRTRALYRAALANPAALTDRRFPKRELLPGREPIWRLLSRMKRWLGFSPRAG